MDSNKIIILILLFLWGCSSIAMNQWFSIHWMDAFYKPRTKLEKAKTVGQICVECGITQRKLLVFSLFFGPWFWIVMGILGQLRSTQLGFDQRYKPCPDCNGLPKVIGRRCTTCGGTGIVPREKQQK